MIELRFSGWFQCRLATDPDPYDEVRGVSGYVHAYVGEPDLDRRIVFQNPAFSRSYSPPVGVHVDQVVRDGVPASAHPLLGAFVDLLDSPHFEGRNGVIADDGLEPVYPFRLEVARQGFRLARGIAPKNPAYPFPELFAAGVEAAPDEIRAATGVQDLVPLWQERKTELSDSVGDQPADEQPGVQERIAFLDQQLMAAGGGAARFFFARMRYEYTLASELELKDPEQWLPEAAASSAEPWPVRFWFGGWDADVLCGYARGTITIGQPDGAVPGSSRPALITDRRP